MADSGGGKNYRNKLGEFLSMIQSNPAYNFSANGGSVNQIQNPLESTKVDVPFYLRYKRQLNVTPVQESPQNLAWKQGVMLNPNQNNPVFYKKPNL